MASEPDEEQGEEEEKKGGKLKLIIIAVVALLVLGGGGAGAFLFLGGSEPEHEMAEGEEGHGEGGQGEESHANAGDGHGAADDGHGDSSHDEPVSGEAPTMVFIDLPDVIVNLRAKSKRMRFLKLKVALEAASEELAENVKALTPRIMDSFQLYLRALTVEEVQGSGGMQMLKEELIARINHSIKPNRVDDVLIKEMLVQ